MDETRGANSEGFQPLEQEQNQRIATSGSKISAFESDPLGVRHWPGLLKYLEENFSFSTALLSIIGYVIIAAFGAMRSIGQFLAYIFFLFFVMIVYGSNKKNIGFVISAAIIIFILCIVIMIQNRSLIMPIYGLVDRVFQIEFIPKS